MSNPPKILMIATSAASMGAGGDATGVWLEELTMPYYVFLDAGADITLASIAGGRIPIDSRSLGDPGTNDASVERYLTDDHLQALVAGTPRFSDIDPTLYDAVFLPGGHGTMFDYPDSAELAALVAYMDAAGKVIAAVCHGPAGLVAAVREDGTPFVSGRRVAGFADSEELAVGLQDSVPFLLETKLIELGAAYERGPDFAPFAILDGNLVTGQNPASAGPAAALVMEILGERA